MKKSGKNEKEVIQMNNRIRTSLVIVIVVGLVPAITGCAKRQEQYGQAISSHQVTSMASILTAPDEYMGKTVIVQGKIVEECPTGCWFDIQQGGAKMRIDIHPAGLAIPQRVGKTVTVEGQVINRDGQVLVSGRGVEIK